MRSATAVLCGLLLFFMGFPGLAASPDPKEELQRRLENTGSREYALLQELLEIDSRLHKLTTDKEALAAQQEQLEGDLALAQKREHELAQELSAGSTKVGQSLRFFQRYGASPYLLAAFLSTDLADFFVRWELMQRYVNFLLARVRHQLALYVEVQKIKEEINQKERELGRAAARLDALEQELVALRNHRQLALEEVRRQSSHYRQALLALEQAWQEALPSLEAVLATFPNFPWQRLSPDRVTVGQGRVLAEFSQAKINEVLLGGGGALEGVRFELVPQRLVIPGPGFRLQGSLAVTGPRHLTFTPLALEMGGLPLDKSTWDVLLPQPAFTIELPPPALDLEYSNLEIRDGVMTLELLPPSPHTIR
ncbi:murein hydrolase activator EnvC family protein [Thermanaeromonas sp. C210]|uniref:murein hydrolase activator EnvC family protein n=1 Tax=Thermanaeromonas sp. C210 TaxID=2731925 RepID=UPI00155C5906|nr:hypothetical protein [Thermanaeromonas sp. C210]GFN22700.1 hypothetical protein TAMC210_10160 [Thermanaeromonas sp. C210]